MRILIAETTPGEFADTPADIIQHKAEQGLSKALTLHGVKAKHAHQHDQRGGEVDLPQHAADYLTTAFAERSQRMWADVAELLHKAMRPANKDQP